MTGTSYWINNDQEKFWIIVWPKEVLLNIEWPHGDSPHDKIRSRFHKKYASIRHWMKGKIDIPTSM